MRGCYFKNIVSFIVPKLRYNEGLRVNLPSSMGGKILRKKRKIQPMHIEPGLYPSNVDLVLTMNVKVRERIVAQNYIEIYVSVDKILQKEAILLPEDHSISVYSSRC